MPRYVVLASFTDIEDKTAKNLANSYYVGQKYPREGYAPTEARIKQLLGRTNKRGKPVIADKPIAADETPAKV